MKHAASIFFFSVLLILGGCGGGSSDSGSGSDGGTVPQSLVGTYSGTFQGSGTNANGSFTCSGAFQMTISQSGSNLVVRLRLDPVVVTPCDNAFDFTGGGTYNPTTGAVSITSSVGNTTISINGEASESNGKIMISGSWSTTETNSNDVIAAGTWTATTQ